MHNEIFANYLVRFVIIYKDNDLFDSFVDYKIEKFYFWSLPKAPSLNSKMSIKHFYSFHNFFFKIIVVDVYI